MSRLDRARLDRAMPEQLDDLNPINGAIFNFPLLATSTFYPNLKLGKKKKIQEFFSVILEYKVELKMTLCITCLTEENVS